MVDTLPGGTTALGSFRLGGPVVAGPYEYTLFRSSVDASNSEAWYLRSTISPGPAPTPDPRLPNYRPETSLYAALPSMALTYGRTLMDTLHERTGDQGGMMLPAVTEERVVACADPQTNYRCITRLPAQPDSQRYASLGWARIIGQHGNQDGGPYGIFRNGPNYDYNLFAFQAGLDLYRGWNADGSRDHAGVYAAIGRMEGDVSHFNGLKAGTNTLDAYSLGAYWTHFGATGWYLDAVAQGTWYDGKADSKRLAALKTDGFGFGASLEGGYPIQLGMGWVVEPQAQIVYQTLSLDNAADSAAQVRFRDADSLAGRIGARFAKTWALDGEPSLSGRPRGMTTWFRASLWQEFLGNPKTEFSSATGFIPFRSDLGGTWVQLNAGVSAEIARQTSLFASAGYQVGIDGRRHAYDGRLGLRVTW